MELERELKYLLPAQGWRALLELARAQGRLESTVLQTNTYLDTQGHHWAAQGVLLRVRSKGDAHRLTCKRRLRHQGTGQHCEETHTSLSAQQAQAVIADPEGLRGASWSAFEAAQAAAPLPQEQPLSVIGVLVTERSRVLSPSGRFTWELDRSTYLDQEDFELECEAEALAPAQRELEEHLRHLGVSAREGAPPKVARLLARAREIALGGALV